MPSLWFKHENPDIQPYEVPYPEGQDPSQLVTSNTGNGWSLVADESAPLDPPADPPPSDNALDLHDEEQ